MAQAFRCDRCGHFWEESAHKILSGNALHLALKSGWYPEKVDICTECNNELHLVLLKWWNKSDEQKL